MSCLKATGTVFIYICMFLAVITFIPGLPPQNAEFEEYSVVQPRNFDPRLGPKNRLNGAQKLFEGEFIGAETFDAYNGQLYTGIYGGYVVRVEEDRIVPIVKFGKKCDGIWQDYICGRPLGLKFDKKGNLFVVDCYYGIFKVNVTTGEYTNIVNISEPINGKAPMIPNSIDIAENGDLYWTDSSTDFQLNHLAVLSLMNPSGRLMHYNAATKENKVLLQNLVFANGVKLSDDESFVLVVETLAYRIKKYYLKGPKAGQQEIFIDGLPGLPDNLQSDNHGGFLVPILTLIDSEHPILPTSLMSHPYLRKMIVRLLLLMKVPFKLLNDFLHNIYIEKILYAITATKEFISDRSVILRIDASGNIIEILSADDNIISSISEAYIHNDYLWFGSPWQKYIARVPLKQAFPDLANNEQLSSHKQSEKQSERTKRNTDSVSTNSKKAPAQKSTAIPTTTSKPTTAPTTTSKPTTVPKPSSVSNKPTTTDGSNIKLDTKPVSKSMNAEVKDSAKPNVKFETSSKTRDDSLETSTAKNIKVEDTPVKQKVPKSKSKKEL